MLFLQIDAFTRTPFRGNPAGFCFLNGEERSGEWMQLVAREMNLSETAFVSPRTDGAFDLRWFTPALEVDLCGHATLASAHALWEEGILAPEHAAHFHTLSGLLTASRAGDAIRLDFPAERAIAADAPEAISRALGVSTVWTGRNRLDWLIEVRDASILRAIKPDFAVLGTLESRGVIVTAVSDSDDCDFVSRYFAPAFGIDEDPVTGSTHCALGPYWETKLNRTGVMGYQASARGGYVRAETRGDRVLLEGHAVTVVRGTLLF